MSDLCPVAVSQSQDTIEDENQADTVGESNLLLLKHKKYCDVTFTFPNLPDKIDAHEFCLKSRSPVLAKIFRMRKSGNVTGNEIEISEASPGTFQHFLEFIYADKLEVDIAGALDLLELAQKYKVQPLTQKCEELLQSEIPIMDSVKVFESARRYGRRELMDRAGAIMIESFLKLVRAGALANAEEETLVYLLECDDLSVKEVGLFQLIMDWGRNQVGTADEHLLKDKLKNLILMIRYTNIAPDEFTKVVVPTGLLSAEENVSVYSYYCGDEVTRRDLNIKFNTTRRKNVNRQMVTRHKYFYTPSQLWLMGSISFPAFSWHAIRFKAELVGKEGLGYLLEKTVIAGITFVWPQVHSQYKENHVLNFKVSIREHSGTAKEGDSTTKFEKKLWSCKHGGSEDVAVEAPVELISGRSYSVVVEDLSTPDLMISFRNHLEAYSASAIPNTIEQANVELEDACFTFKDIQKSTDFYRPGYKQIRRPKVFSMIRGIKIGLV